MRASSRWNELSSAGAWIEAANGSRHDRVELLHDDEALVRSFHDPFDLGDLVTGVQQSIDCQFENGEGVKSVAPRVA